MIETQNPLALHLCPRDGGGDLFLVDYGPVSVFVVYRDKLIITALPNTEGKFDGLVAFRRHERAEKAKTTVQPLRTGKVSAKQVGRGILPSPKKKPRRRETGIVLPPLPPRHLHPKRDEAYLAKLRAQMTRCEGED